MVRMTVAAIISSLGLVGCAGMTLGQYLQSQGGKGPALKMQANQIVNGPSGGPAVIVQYRGGPNETPVVETCPTCSGPWPDDLVALNGGSSSLDRARDDQATTQRVAPAPGVEQVPLQAPTWCDGYKGQAKAASERISLAWFNEGEASSPKEVMDALRRISWAACDRQGYEPRQRHVVNMLQSFLNVTHQTMADVEPTLKALAAGEEVTAPAGSQDPSVEAWLRCDVHRPLARAEDHYPLIDRLDVLDGLGKITDLDRAALLCSDLPDAVSALDMKRIDWEGAKRDLKAHMPAGPRRDAAERQIDELHAKQQQGMATVKAEDVRVAEAAYSDWFTKTLQPNKATLEVGFNALARALGSAPPTNCGEGVLPEIERQFKAKKLKTVQEMDAQWQDPVLGVLFLAKATCDAFENAILGSAELALANKGMSSLGPRHAAMNALRKGMPVFAVKHKKTTGSERMDEYLIKSVTPKGDKLLVVPSNDEYDEPIMSCKETTRIERILPDGSIRYKDDCVQTGTRKVKRDYASFFVSKEFAALFKPGRWTMTATDAPNAGRDRGAGEAAEKQGTLNGVPSSVFPSQKAAIAGQPILYYYGITFP